MEHLREELQLHAQVRFKLAVLSAASNVSGLMGGDEEVVSGLCHDYGALNVWDMATAAPYASVDMNPQRQSRLSKDAVVLSPHKLLGGVSTPGVLLVKKRLLLTSTPSTPAGGTVFYVSPSHHRYLQNFQEREEGGTPDIVRSHSGWPRIPSEGSHRSAVEDAEAAALHRANAGAHAG